MEKLKVKQNNYGLYVDFYIKKFDGTVYDLSGKSATLKIWKDSTLYKTISLVIQDADNGITRWNIVSGDTNLSPDEYNAEIEITSSGYVEDTVTFILEIVESV